MPGPTTERLDNDFQLLRNDMQDIKIALARLDARSNEYEELRTEVRRNTTDLTSPSAQFRTLVGTGKWLGSIILASAIYGVISISSRMTAVEVQVKSIDNRLGAVETQVKSIDNRLGTVEVEVKGVKLLLNEIKEAINRRPVEAAAEQDERFRRIARSVVEEALKRSEKPSPNP